MLKKLESEHAIALRKVEEKLKELNGSEIEVEIKIRNNLQSTTTNPNGATNTSNTNTNSSLQTSFNDEHDKSHVLVSSLNHNHLGLNNAHDLKGPSSKSTTISTAISATSSSSCSLSHSNKPEHMNNLSKSNSNSAEVVASPLNKPINNNVVNMAKTNANKTVNNCESSSNNKTLANIIKSRSSKIIEKSKANMMIHTNPLLAHTTSLSNQVVSVKSFVNRSTSINGCDLAVQSKLGKLNIFVCFVSFRCVFAQRKREIETKINK